MRGGSRSHRVSQRCVVAPPYTSPQQAVIRWYRFDVPLRWRRKQLSAIVPETEPVSTGHGQMIGGQIIKAREPPLPLLVVRADARQGQAVRVCLL